MLPTPTVSQFRKAAASSPQQACVMIYRDATRAILWDDKLADIGDHEVSPEQCLTFEHDQFEQIQHTIRTGEPVRNALTITQTSSGAFIFSAAAEFAGSAGSARLHFDRHEYHAFITGVRDREFERELFTPVPLD
ncbi:hypothetical protein OG225_06425 [Nocardia sp. NBC_01377]|uniref:hypothetical protein n=1 Tax=Nocardia sp. NBC_01377 TaxID=2903595 RepID=UPI00324B0E49